MSLGLLTSPIPPAQEWENTNLRTSPLPGTMATIARPTMRQHQCLIRAAHRNFTTQSVNPAPMSLNAAKFSSPSMVPQPSLRSTSLRGTSPATLRVAGFHATGRRPILPAGPRKSLDAQYIGLQLTLSIEVIDGTGN